MSITRCFHITDNKHCPFLYVVMNGYLFYLARGERLLTSGYGNEVHKLLSDHSTIKEIELQPTVCRLKLLGVI